MANENTFKDLLESVGTSIDDKESVSAIMKSLLSARNILSQNDLDIIAVLLADKNLDASSKAEMICKMCKETGGKKSGNVNEWCWDWCDYDDAFTIENDIDSRSRLKGDGHYVCGGSWNDPPCKVKERDYRRSEYSKPDVGFRLARSVM